MHQYKLKVLYCKSCRIILFFFFVSAVKMSVVYCNLTGNYFTFILQYSLFYYLFIYCLNIAISLELLNIKLKIISHLPFMAEVAFIYYDELCSSTHSLSSLHSIFFKASIQTRLSFRLILLRVAELPAMLTCLNLSPWQYLKIKVKIIFWKSIGSLLLWCCYVHCEHPSFTLEILY